MSKRTHIYRVMPPDLHSRPTGGSPGFQYRIGEWTPPVENPRICGSGYHTLNAAGLLDYVKAGDVLVECRYRGQVNRGEDKATNASVMPVRILGTVTARALRLTAADAAESVAHIYNERYPGDPTLDAVIHTVRAHAYGGATETERALARDAADAAYAAAYAAAATDAAYAAAAYAAAYAAYAAYAAAADADAAYAAPRGQSKMRTGEALIRHIIEGE
jgi:hypothetical protein